MNELVSIQTRNMAGTDVQTVIARELHQFLEVGKDFTTWVKDRVQQYGFQQGEDYEVFPGIGENSQGGRPSKEYAITLDMAKELAMVERNEKGRQARRYFIECERIAKGSHRRVRQSAQLRHLASEFRGGLAIAKLAGLSGNQATLAAAKAVKTMTGADPLLLIGSAHLVAEAQVRHYTPTELGVKYGESGQAFNKRLERAGLQVKNIHGQWQVSDQGSAYAVLLDTGKCHSNGTPVQQVKWLESVLDVLTRPAVA